MNEETEWQARERMGEVPFQHDWSEEFDNYKLEEYGKWKIGRAEVKDFISTHFYPKQELEEMIEGMKVDIDDNYDDEEIELAKKLELKKTPEFLRERRTGYNRALSDLLQKLREKK